MNKELFLEELIKLGIKPTNEQLEKINIYSNELLKYNEHTNLTAIKTEEEVYLKHFYDSLTIVKVCDLKNVKTLIDVGSGAGFPGLVLKIFYPDIEITLLDSNNKKTKFLNYMVNTLNLNKIKIVNDRIENHVKINRYQYDVVTARAVAHLRILSELCLPLTNKDGVFIALKGNISNELEESVETLECLNSKIIKKEQFLLPIELSNRNILVIKREGDILDIYPRQYDKIIKKPLKKNNK